MDTVYTATITRVGAEAASFAAEGMIVTFGDGAPAELAEFCYIIEGSAPAREIRPGDTLTLPTGTFKVSAVGSAANKNLTQLGHATLNFSGLTEAELAGTFYLRGEGNAPILTVGDSLSFS